MHVQLFNYHTAGTQVHTCPASSSVVSSQAEASGNASGKVICHLWNAGHCIAVNPQCQFRHACSRSWALIVLLLVLCHSLLVLACRILRSQSVTSVLHLLFPFKYCAELLLSFISCISLLDAICASITFEQILSHSSSLLYY